MRPLAFRILLTASTLLLVATTALWLRAQWVKDLWFYRTVAAPPGRVDVDTFRFGTQPRTAQLFIHRVSYLTPDAPTQSALLADLPRDPRFRHRTLTPHPSDRRGFGYDRFDGEPDLPRSRSTLTVNNRPYLVGGRSITLHAPWWSLAALFSITPACAAWRHHRRRARRPTPGHCEHCDYDLRSTPDPAGPLLPTCPECGRRPTAR